MAVVETAGKQGAYQFGYSPAIAEMPFSEVQSLIESSVSDREPLEVLGGRGFVLRKALDGIGPIVLKQYRRGGVLGRVNPSYYLRLGVNRPAREYRLLQTVRELSVNAPEPLMWVTTGGFLYQGWLLMREIPHRCSLAQIGDSAIDELEPVLEAFAAQVEQLILAGVYHVDLHPGNVLLGEDGTVSIIDFDKARFYRDAPNKLRDLYLCRWRRAVIKHGLPDYLAEYVCAFLRKNFAIAASI